MIYGIENMSKIRIIRILNRFNLGGPTYNASYLTKYLDKDFETLLIGGKMVNMKLHLSKYPILLA